MLKPLQVLVKAHNSHRGQRKQIFLAVMSAVIADGCFNYAGASMPCWQPLRPGCTSAFGTHARSVAKDNPPIGQAGVLSVLLIPSGLRLPGPMGPALSECWGHRTLPTPNKIFIPPFIGDSCVCRVRGPRALSRPPRDWSRPRRRS